MHRFKRILRPISESDMNSQLLKWWIYPSCLRNCWKKDWLKKQFQYHWWKGTNLIQAWIGKYYWYRILCARNPQILDWKCLERNQGIFPKTLSYIRWAWALNFEFAIDHSIVPRLSIFFIKWCSVVNTFWFVIWVNLNCKK